jgi:asparagine synthase (glutamine-hydrolysing)
MAFMYGAFGAFCTPSYAKKLSQHALNHASDQTLQTISFDHGFICAGYAKNDSDRSDIIMPLDQEQGMFIGRIFDRASYGQIRCDAHQTAMINADPTTLSKKFWGRYVGALYNTTNNTLTILRDPQGLLTLFYALRPDGIIFSTDLSLVYEALDKKTPLDVNFFAEHVVARNNALPTTPFKEINELLPGMGLTIQRDGRTISYDLLWDLASMRGSFITDEDAFEEELLATLRSCTKAWVGDAAGVCVELSGGTDSSGLMILLRDVVAEDKNLIAVNYMDSKIASSNEIEFAQETADACNAPLYFLDWQNSTLLDPLPQDWLPNRPSTLFLFNNLHRQVAELARQYNCPVMMNGQGGDHVFLAPQPQYALADYWLDRGVRGSSAILQHLSAAHRAPWSKLVLSNMNAIMRYYRGVRSSELPDKDTPFFTQDFAGNLIEHDFYLNPFLKKFHPAQAIHIEALSHAVAYAELNQGMPSMTKTHPLLSLPIVELGLRIPTYQSFHSGLDRIFFRRAVSRIKKTKSLWRHLKGGTTGSMAKAAEHQVDDIRDMLFGGILVKNNVVDTKWLDNQLVRVAHGQVDNLWPILHMMTGQMWLNQWGL